jgi:hypothetical protein
VGRYRGRPKRSRSSEYACMRTTRCTFRRATSRDLRARTLIESPDLSTRRVRSRSAGRKYLSTRERAKTYRRPYLSAGWDVRLCSVGRSAGATGMMTLLSPPSRMTPLSADSLAGAAAGRAAEAERIAPRSSSCRTRVPAPLCCAARTRISRPPETLRSTTSGVPGSPELRAAKPYCGSAGFGGRG